MKSTFTLPKLNNESKILFIGSFGFGLTVSAQSKDLDANLDACLHKAVSTAAQRDCIGKAEKSWDAVLNRNYKILMTKLPADARKKLQDYQRKWLAS